MLKNKASSVIKSILLALSLLSLSSCELLRKSDNYGGICTSHIKVFNLSEEEFESITPPNLKNMALVNCTLALKCGYELPNATESLVSCEE